MVVRCQDQVSHGYKADVHGVFYPVLEVMKTQGRDITPPPPFNASITGFSKQRVIGSVFVAIFGK